MSRVSIVLLAILILFVAAACGGSSSDQATSQELTDDDNGGPIIDDDNANDDDTADDDIVDDDAVDDDTVDDDAVDDDAVDDDAVDDDAVDDDAVDDDAVDDDAVDDDATDDDTTVDPPTVEIVTPENGQTYYTNEQTVQILISNAASVTVQLDGNDVTDQLTIGENAVTGTIDGVTAGQHTLSALVENDPYSDTDSVTFTVELDEPYLDLTLSKYSAQFGTAITRTVHVYDEMGNDITNEVTIDYDIDPETGFNQVGETFTFTELGDWTFSASCEYAGRKITLSDTEVHTAFDHIPDSIQLHLAAATTPAGVPVIANTSVFNSFGDLLSGFPVMITADPSSGVTINGNQLRFTIVGDYTITAYPVGYPALTAEDDIAVTPGSPVSLDLSVSTHSADAGELVDYDVEMLDSYGNQWTSGWTMASLPSAGAEFDTVNKTVKFTRSGAFLISANYVTLHSYETITVTDNVPPTLEWTSPARGTFTSSPMITLQGVVSDVGGDVESLYINGTWVAFSDTGQFTQMVALAEGYNLFKAVVEDSAGNTNSYAISVLRGSYLANDAWVEEAVGARVNELGLDKIEEIAEEYIAEFDITSLLPDPLVDESFDLGIVSCDVYGTITSVDYDISVDLDAKPGYIQTTATITNFVLGIDFELTCGDGADAIYAGTISFSTLSASVPIYLDVVDNNLSVTIGTVTIDDPQGFDLNITGFDPTLLNLLETVLMSVVVPMAEDMINEIVQTEIPPLIEEALGDLQLEFSFDILGHTLTVEANFESIDIGDPGLVIWMNGNSYADSYNPETPAHPGSFFTAGTPPTFGNTSPGGSVYQLGAAVADDIVNQALYTAYRSGLLTMTLDENSGFSLDLTAGDLELFFPGISDIYGAEAPVVIKLDPYLPPIIDFSPPADQATVQLQLGEMFVDIVVVGPEKEETTVLQMAVFLKAPVTVDSNDTGDAFSFEIGEPVIDLDIMQSMSLLPDAFFENFVPVLVDFVLPLLSEFLEDFPIPAFEGYTLNVVEMTIFGYLNDYLGAFGDLVDAPLYESIGLWD